MAESMSDCKGILSCFGGWVRSLLSIMCSLLYYRLHTALSALKEFFAQTALALLLCLCIELVYPFREPALKFYERSLGGKILMMMMMTYEDSPMATQMPPDWEKKISQENHKRGVRPEILTFAGHILALGKRA